MKDFKGETTNEDKMIRATQRAIGALDNGWVGAQTMSDIAIKVGADCWPITLQIYSNPMIICKDIDVIGTTTRCSAHKNSISGSFSYQSKPCSILVNDGKTIAGAACHAWLNKPECVLYRLNNGKFGVKRCLSASDLPSGVKWAVGAMGLLDMYDPGAEGFSGAYADVLRQTNHTVLGVKNEMIYLVYCKTMTGKQVDTFCKDKLKLDLAIMLDGGHVAAINGEESFARINTAQTQYYLIKAAG